MLNVEVEGGGGVHMVFSTNDTGYNNGSASVGIW